MRSHPIPPILINIVNTALDACDGVKFHPGSTCSRCGGTLSGYDEREKRFAVLVEDDKTRTVTVIIQRSYCRTCKTITSPPEPFYPGTRVGSPVVDLCRYLSKVMPYSRASTYVGRLGVHLDRWSARNYALMRLPEVPSVDIFGMPIPVSIIDLSTIAGSRQDTGSLTMEDVLMACHYPSGITQHTKQSDHENAENHS
jgi:hypothetical protein